MTTVPLKTLGQFADQPEFDVVFEMPDLVAGGTTMVTLSVHCGETDVVHSVAYPSHGYERGTEVRCIIDGWDGDTPRTRVETVRR